MSDPQIHIPGSLSLEHGLEREWLDTNDLGGWASTTMIGCNTRRYHGLLVAALRPPVERSVLWSHSDEELRWAGGSIPLSTNLYSGAVHPRGFEHQDSFSLLPFPTTTFAEGEARVERRTWMEAGRNTTCVVYENRGAERLTLSVRPLLAFRDYHALGHANDSVRFTLEESGGRIALQPYASMPRLYFHHNAARVIDSPLWYYRFEYPCERDRGLDWEEDLFAAFTLEWELNPGDRARLGATIHEGALDIDASEARERERRRIRGGGGSGEDGRVVLLRRTAASFLVEREPAGKTVIAGYHWFTDWGRDTMIALPGLCLQDGDGAIAREILLQFAAYLDGGMIPNRFPDGSQPPEYNTVDASLWFVHAIHAYIARFDDRELLHATLFPAVQAVIDGYRRGTRYGIRVDADGLVAAGEPGVQLTWMDAKVGDFVVTPRIGKPVEINALWYHALRCAAELAVKLGRDGSEYGHEAERVRVAFNNGFWNEDTGCLYDVLADDGPDGKVRPNQLLAVSLRGDLLSSDRAAAVLAAVERDLLTPVGLRSLTPRDPDYRQHYRGDPWQRDTAYHQGTVWAWLIGPFVDALVRVHGLTEQTRLRIRQVLEPLLAHTAEAGLGSISEIFDADPPHTPRGCISQAWSVAEVLRVYRQYLSNEI